MTIDEETGDYVVHNDVKWRNRGDFSVLPSELRATTRQRLDSYALAATAAGVAILACPVPAQCAPVCKTVDLRLVNTGSYALNPLNSRVPPFYLAETNKDVSSLSGTAWNRGFLNPNSGEANVLLSKNLPAALPRGTRIGPGGQFGKGKSYGMLFTYGPTNNGTYRHHLGNLHLGRFNYVGFRFSFSGHEHYGWVRVKVTFQFSGDGPYGTMLVEQYGYETTPNTAILAGECSASQPSGDALPVASHSTVVKHGNYPSRSVVRTSNFASLKFVSLGLLAVGASGLLFWRRKEDK